MEAAMALDSSDRLEEQGIKLGTPGYKASGLSTYTMVAPKWTIAHSQMMSGPMGFKLMRMTISCGNFRTITFRVILGDWERLEEKRQ